MSKEKSRTPGRVKSGIGRIFGKSMMELSLFSKVDAHTRHLDNKPSLPSHRRHVKDKSGDEVKRENEEVGTERNKGDTPSKGLEQGAGEMVGRVVNGADSVKGGENVKGLDDKQENGHAAKRGLGDSWSVDINSGSKSMVCRRNSFSAETAGTARTGEDNRKRFERKGSSDRLNASTESRSKKKSRKLTKKEREKRKKYVKRENEDWSENDSDEDAKRLLNRRNSRFGGRNNDRSKKQYATAKSVAYDLDRKNSTDISNLGSNKLAAQYNFTEDWSFEIKEENEKMDVIQGLGRNSCNENESPCMNAFEDVKVSEMNQIDNVGTMKGSLIENVGAADIKSVNAVKITDIQCVDAKKNQISKEKSVEQFGHISDQIGDSIKQKRDTIEEEDAAIVQISNESSEQYPKDIIFPQMQSTPKKETIKRCSNTVAESTGNNETTYKRMSKGAEIGKAEHENQGLSPFHFYSSEELRKIGRNMPPVDVVKNGLIDFAEMPEDIVNVDKESDDICSDEWKPGYGLFEEQKINEPYYMSERCQSPYKDFERLYAINDEKNEGGRLERIAEEVVQFSHFQFSAPMEFSNPPPNFHPQVPEQFRPPLTMSDSELMPDGHGLFPLVRGSRRGYGRGNARARPFTHNRYDYGNSWISGSSGYSSGYSDKPFRRDYAHMVENRKELLLMDLGASWTHQESEDWTSEIADCGNKKETIDNENVKECVKLSKNKQESKVEIQETENWESEIDEKEKINMNLDACVKEGDVLQECVKKIKCELIDENVYANVSNKELYLPPPIPEILDLSENIEMEKDTVVEKVQKSDKPYLPPPIPDMGELERNENENVTGLVDGKIETSNQVFLPPSIPSTENKRMVKNPGSLYLPPSPPTLEVSLDADKLVNVLSKEKESYVEQLGNNVESLDNVKDGYERDDDTEKDSLEASSYGLSKASATKICAWFEKMPDETSSISSGWTQPEAVYTNVASETEVSDLPLDNVVKSRKEKLDRNVESSSSGSMISVKSDVINATQEESTDGFKVSDEFRGTAAQMNDPYGSRGSGYSPGYEHSWYYNPWMNGNCGYPSEQEYWYHTQQQMAWEWYVYQQELERMHQVDQAISRQTMYKSEMSERNADMGVKVGMGKKAESKIVETSKKLHEKIEPVCADPSDNDKPKKWATWKDSQELGDYEEVNGSNEDKRAEVFGTEYARERGVGKSFSKNNERPLQTVPETSEVKGTENIPSAKNQNTTNSDSVCRCRPCDIKYIIWQECKCPAGNPRKLRILPHVPGEGSVDLGYQSYESLEHEEPTLHSRLSAWQPFCSTPALKEPILELTEPSIGCERKIPIGQGQYQDVDQRCSANREVFACPEKATKESSATEKSQTQDYQGQKFPHRDYRNLPKCLETSASHLAAAMEGLNQAGISEKSLDSALHSVTKRLEEFKKQAGMGDCGEDLGSDNVVKRSKERDTDFNGNEIGGGWAEAQGVEKRNSSELSERHIGAYSEKIQGFSQFGKERGIQNVSEMNPSGYQKKGGNFASLDSGLKPQLFSPERPKTPPSSPVKGQNTQKVNQQYLNARQLQQQVGWKPQTLTSLLETIQKTTGVKFDESGKEVIKDNGDEEIIPEHDMLGTNFRPPGFLWGPNDYRFPRAMTYRPDCRGMRPPPSPYTPPPPPPPPPPTPASAEDKDHSKKGQERFNWDPRMPQSYQMPMRMPPFMPQMPPGPQMPYGPQLPYAEGKVPWKLVEYAASDESSGSDIEPFDLATLNKVDSMTFYSGKHTVNNKTPANHTAKKFKTSPEYEEVKKGATKVARDVPGKVKQKTLKSFTAEDPLKKGMVVYSQKRHSPWNNHPSSVVASRSAKEESQNMYNKGATRNKAFATVVAENNRPESSQGASGNSEYKGETCPIVDEKENASSYMLPPKNNSPFFWGNYTPPSNSALTGKAVEPEPTAKMGWEPQGSTPKMKRRLSNLGVSPGQSGSPALYSPAETETEIQSVRTQWRTNFKLFHDFGVMYIDTHCHLDFLFSREKFEGRTLSAYREKHPETFPDQFEGCVAVFCNPQTFTPGGGLWQDVAKEDNVWIAMGCHPKMATGFNQNAEKGLKRCMKHPKCIALGEIGLDYSGSFYQHMEVQKRVFRIQLEMAITMRKPLVIHCRDAEEDCLEIIKEIPKDELEFSNPGLAVTVAKEIAQYQEIPVAMVLRQCRINTKFIYGV
ncbi:TATD2-like protein [Mya arenaria]|uniref:TATD2-like protein n=1 Tax=Mya arenaria TaxID=6604 RepID=A0ABY7G631_MYAAR|nr:TATD2-like protein [Mya arenaria]